VRDLVVCQAYSDVGPHRHRHGSATNDPAATLAPDNLMQCGDVQRETARAENLTTYSGAPRWISGVAYGPWSRTGSGDVPLECFCMPKQV
jgi:hypothetical protein